MATRTVPTVAGCYRRCKGMVGCVYFSYQAVFGRYDRSPVDGDGRALPSGGHCLLYTSCNTQNSNLPATISNHGTHHEDSQSDPAPLAKKMPIASATMSSTLNSDHSASKCIDGVTNNVCHTTSNENEAWLRLDLGSKKSIASVKIWNRHNCCQERFGAHVVQTSNDGTSFTTCGSYTLPSGPGPYTEPCDASARYVRLRMTHTGTLNLAEVQVMARTSQPTADTQHAFVSCLLSPWHARQHARIFVRTHDSTTACAVSICSSATCADGYSAYPGQLVWKLGLGGWGYGREINVHASTQT